MVVAPLLDMSKTGLFLVCCTVLLVSPCSSRSFGTGSELQRLVDSISDELLTHQGLVQPQEQDFERDNEIPHPVLVHNWGSRLALGQVSAVTVDNNDDPVVFHRGKNQWDMGTFEPMTNKLTNPQVIDVDTILTLNWQDGSIRSSWGKDLFYLPHGLTIDLNGNTYVTDVGLHQVMRFPPNATKPDLVLGEAFVPGKDDQHFCKPTSVAVSETTGDFFVADGYCNSRVMHYDRQGKLQQIIDNPEWSVVHSLSLNEQENELCVADRENGRIQCLWVDMARNALERNRGEVPTVGEVAGLGRGFAVASKGEALLVVTQNPARGLTFDNSGNGEIRMVDQWGTTDMRQPHDLAISQKGDAVYVAEIGPNRILKFEVVHDEDQDIM